MRPLIFLTALGMGACAALVVGALLLRSAVLFINHRIDRNRPPTPADDDTDATIDSVRRYRPDLIVEPGMMAAAFIAAAGAAVVWLAALVAGLGTAAVAAANGFHDKTIIVLARVAAVGVAMPVYGVLLAALLPTTLGRGLAVAATAFALAVPVVGLTAGAVYALTVAFGSG